MLGELPEVSAHFSRFKVTEIALSNRRSPNSTIPKSCGPQNCWLMRRVDVIGWNGTSSGWLGFEADVRLCERDHLQRPGFLRRRRCWLSMRFLNIKSVEASGYVTPYLDDVQAEDPGELQKSWALRARVNAISACRITSRSPKCPLYNLRI